MTWRYFTLANDPGEILRRIDIENVIGESYIWTGKKWDGSVDDFMEIAFPGLSSDEEWIEISEEETQKYISIPLQHYGTSESGEREGHPFRGNQWTEGEEGGGGGGKSEERVSIKKHVEGGPQQEIRGVKIGAGWLETDDGRNRATRILHAVLDRIPPEHLKTISEIKFFEGNIRFSGGRAYPGVGRDAIYINIGKNSNPMSFDEGVDILLHEVGHRVYRNLPLKVTRRMEDEVAISLRKEIETDPWWRQNRRYAYDLATKRSRKTGRMAVSDEKLAKEVFSDVYSLHLRDPDKVRTHIPNIAKQLDEVNGGAVLALKAEKDDWKAFAEAYPDFLKYAAEKKGIIEPKEEEEEDKE